MGSQRLKIGISMRMTHASSYEEKRDSIAQDWANFMLKEFPEMDWMYLPNIKQGITDYIKTWGIDGFILTGGENVGTDAERDETEIEIIKYALEHKLPLFGVCRGLQLLFEYLGGKIEQGTSEFVKYHVATRHPILYKGEEFIVNSYHQNRLVESSCPQQLSVIAHCKEDNSIEAVSFDKIVGIMWHPERESNTHIQSVRLMKELFKK